VSPDEADNRFLECAAAAGADYLVTGNIKDFPQRFKATRILTPQQFVTQMQVEKK
jgi:predicted nucleic acid-binding protein